jgi:hypothetical protein
VVFHFPTSLPYGGTFHGPQGFQAFYADIYGHYYDVFNYDAHAVLDAGSHVIVPVIARAKAKNGRTTQNEHLFLFAISHGKIVEARLYPTPPRDATPPLVCRPTRRPQRRAERAHDDRRQGLVREPRSSLIRQESRRASRPLKPKQKRWDTYTVSADATAIPGGIHLKMPMTK